MSCQIHWFLWLKKIDGLISISSNFVEHHHIMIFKYYSLKALGILLVRKYFPKVHSNPWLITLTLDILIDDPNIAFVVSWVILYAPWKYRVELYEGCMGSEVWGYVRAVDRSCSTIVNTDNCSAEWTFSGANILLKDLHDICCSCRQLKRVLEIQ